MHLNILKNSRHPSRQGYNRAGFLMRMTIKRNPVQGLAMAAVALISLLYGGCCLGNIHSQATKGGKATAIRGLHNMAEQGDAEAQYLLSVAYYYGFPQGFPEEYIKYASRRLRAYEQEHGNAQCEPGTPFEAGANIPPDFIEAYKWASLAREKDYPDAQWVIDSLVLHRMTQEQITEGKRRVAGFVAKKELAPVIQGYRTAAEQGDAEAQRRLGFACREGEGIARDYTAAAHWFSMAAKQGDAEAECCLGNAYDSGQGIPQNYTEAGRWFRRAAEQGNAAAQYNLKEYYKYGLGVPQDFVEAYKWLIISAAHGGKEHKNDARSETFILHLTPAQIAEGQKRAADFVPKKASTGTK